MTKNNYRNFGFTLIEMAIVLVIAGLLLTVVIGMGNALIAQSRISATKSKQETIKTAILSYIARNSRMPCPAVPIVAPGNPGYGIEATSPGTCDAVQGFGIGQARVVIGLVPWITLGLSDEGGEDGYYNRFTYAVTANATNLNRNTIAGMLGNITIHTRTPIVLGLPPVGNQSNVCTPVGGGINPCLQVAVIISHGLNGNGSYNRLGNQLALPPAAATDELANTDINSSFVQKDFSEGANPFDDILLALNPSELLTPLTINGSVRDFNAALQHNFDMMVAAATSQAAINRTGGPPPDRIYNLPADAPALNLPPANITDPWGRPIIYTVNTPNINSTTPEGVAFSMTSVGQDGVLGTADDIVNTLRVSELQSKFLVYGF